MPKREAVWCGLPFRGDGSFRPSSFVALVVEIDVDAVFRHADVDLLFLGSLDRDPVCGIACRSGLRGGFGRNDGYGVGGHPLLHTVDFPVAEFVARLVEEFVQAVPLFAAVLPQDQSAGSDDRQDPEQEDDQRGAPAGFARGDQAEEDVDE